MGDIAALTAAGLNESFLFCALDAATMGHFINEWL